MRTRGVSPSKRTPPLPVNGEAVSVSSLHEQNEKLRVRLEEAEDTLRAIRCGEVDALIVSRPEGDRVYTLEGAETTYRFLVEEMNEGALLLCPDGTILHANARFADWVGVPLEQVIGAPLEGFFAPEERVRLKDSLSAAKDGSARQELHLSAPTSTRPVAVSLRSLQWERIQGFSVVISDLSQREAAEAALRDANERLEERVTERTAQLTQANESLLGFQAGLERLVAERTAKLQEMMNELQHVSYAIVHDMRAPLRALQGFAELLEEECGLHEAPLKREYFGRIKAAAKRIDMQIIDALRYTKAVLQELPLQTVDLSCLLNELVSSYPNLHSDKADIRLEGKLPVVLGNESLLTQCFSNLLGNAVKFVPEGVRPQVCVRAEPIKRGEPEVHARGATGTASNRNGQPVTSNGVVRVWVEDNGIGIPMLSHSRLFGMFERVNGGYEGTGIGLAIVRKVVERMGGKVGVESEEGKGSRFWVELRTATFNGPLKGA